MNPKELIEADLKKGRTQTEVANKIGVSNATVYKILYTSTKLTVATLTKIAKAYGVPVAGFIAESGPEYSAPTAALSDKEKEMLVMFRQLDERRQARIIETLEDMTLAFRESHGRDNAGIDSKESNSKQRSNG